MLQQRETELAAREAELNRQLATLRRVERDEGMAAELEHKQQAMLERERELAAREAELQSTRGALRIAARAHRTPREAAQQHGRIALGSHP